MSSKEAEGTKNDVLPMYSIQANDMSVPDLPTQIPYTMKTNLNPSAEGLHDPVLLKDDSDAEEGVNNDNNNQQRDEANVDSTPGCCRRYSCCFPMIIIILIWLMMISADAFEHCQDCISSKHEYQCAIETKADYYCKSHTIQICCYYEGDECKEIAYPPELQYSMGQFFGLSMYICFIVCLIPCLCPCGVPIMLYQDCRNQKSSMKRQICMDILCTLCFMTAACCCSYTIYEYYRYPKNRCSSNSDIFGISTEIKAGLRAPNIWIMSQTTYCSFFSLILLCSFSICGTITLILQGIAKKKKLDARIADADRQQQQIEDAHHV